VMERALYYAVDSSASLQYIQGRLAYESFEYTAILSRIMRQEGEDDESRQFRQALTELPVRREFEYQGVKCSRRQLPIALAYAITVQVDVGTCGHRPQPA
jgi:hypothetical protein